MKLYIAVNKKIIKGQVECEASSVREVLELLRVRFGNDFEKEVYNGMLKEGIAVVLNKHPVTPDKLDTSLKDDDTLFLFTAITGG